MRIGVNGLDIVPRNGARSLRVVIVEDEAITAMHFEAMVERLGHEVCGTAMSADEAVQVAGEFRPDLVLMDIRLANGSNGIAAAQEIRRRFDIPALFLSAHIDEATLRLAAPARPLGFLGKPASPDRLAKALASAAESLPR